MTSVSSVPRSSGVLLHPTSLPGPFGIGDLGAVAHAWVGTLAGAGQRWWQVLPVGPTGYGDSPYQAPSTFAGNPNLISPELLAEWGLASREDVAACEVLAGPANYEEVIPRKRQLLRQAWERFAAGDAAGLRPAFESFCQVGWLDDFALFMAIKDAHGGKPWWDWPTPLAKREPAALRTMTELLSDDVAAHRFAQFLFARQWAALREHAHRLGVRIIGDLPIYVAHDSADVWANPDLFLLDANRNPIVVAGVPPDYFAATGQLWGNPIYDWEVHRRSGFRWWADRLRATLGMVDLVRLDHFRGLEAYWAVPFGDPTAERGEWRPGPGADLLDALRSQLGGLPIIAEDLGFITPEVDALRERFGLPGMRILQFAFGGAVEPRFRPHRFDRNVVAYTGTHDNDTSRGWYDKLMADERASFTRYTPDAADDPVRAIVRLGWASVADLAVAPVQDLLGLGTEARLNTPGTKTGNWRWRLPGTDLGSVEWVGWLRELTETYERGGQ
jgi:4-alpha-glucanotransferase